MFIACIRLWCHRTNRTNTHNFFDIHKIYFYFIPVNNQKGARMKNMTDETLDLMAGRFKILSEPMRLKILHSLHDNEMNVQQIVEMTGANQANVSKHLGIMFDAGLLKRRKEGLNSFYSIADESIFKLCDLVCGGIEKNLRKNLSSLKY